MSDKPSSSFGGLLAGLFGNRTNEEGTRVGASPSRKVVGGALLAAGAAYLYKRCESGNLNVTGISTKQ